MQYNLLEVETGGLEACLHLPDVKADATPSRLNSYPAEV